MRRTARVVVAVLVGGLLTSAAVVIRAQARRSVADGIYTNAQADRGAATYASTCVSCHGRMLEGQSGPPLSGDLFLTDWSGQPLSALGMKISKTMPADDPGKLTPAQVADLMAYLLRSAKIGAGATPLNAEEAALNQIDWPKARTAASAAPATAAARTAAFPPSGNMAQLMRGILFPSSNLIFNAQTQDPGQQKAGYQPDKEKGGFSWVDWGAGIYSGWEMLDFAAVAVADSAPLLLTPRRCENGKPAPVDQPDWIKFTQGLAEAGRAALKASQSRNQEAVADSTNQLADACLACHERYRDRPGRTAADPSNKAGRCTP